MFSQGRILLPHTRNGLSAQSIRALLCLGEWSLYGWVKDNNVLTELALYKELEGDEDVLLETGWDAIVV